MTPPRFEMNEYGVLIVGDQVISRHERPDEYAMLITAIDRGDRVLKSPQTGLYVTPWNHAEKLAGLEQEMTRAHNKIAHFSVNLSHPNPHTGSDVDEWREALAFWRTRLATQEASFVKVVDSYQAAIDTAKTDAARNALRHIVGAHLDKEEVEAKQTHLDTITTRYAALISREHAKQEQQRAAVNAQIDALKSKPQLTRPAITGKLTGPERLALDAYLKQAIAANNPVEAVWALVHQFPVKQDRVLSRDINGVKSVVVEGEATPGIIESFLRRCDTLTAKHFTNFGIWEQITAPRFHVEFKEVSV